MFESKSPLAKHIKNIPAIQVDNHFVQNIAPLVPSDAVKLPTPLKAIYLGVEGDVRLTTINNQTVTLKNLAAGIWHPIEAVKVFATGTTAADLMGAW